MRLAAARFLLVASLLAVWEMLPRLGLVDWELLLPFSAVFTGMLGFTGVLLCLPMAVGGLGALLVALPPG